METKELLMTFAELINEAKSGLPVGCIGYDNKREVYNARNIEDVIGFEMNVVASNGFINDGLMVRFRDQRRSKPGEKFNGYRAEFDLAGNYNGVVIVFCRTEYEYKMFLQPSMWSVRSEEITYVPNDDEDEKVVRIYKEPVMLDKITGEERCLDRSASIENKVSMAMKNKFRDYVAMKGDLVFNEKTRTFESK